MQIILLEKIEHLGILGDLVKVKPGYARNYLVPQGKALPANAANIADFETRKTELIQDQVDILENAKLRAEQLSEMTLVVSGRVGLENKLYGSVNKINIIDALAQSDIILKKQEIKLSSPIRHLGEYDIDIHLAPEVNATIQLRIVSDDDEDEDDEEYEEEEYYEDY